MKVKKLLPILLSVITFAFVLSGCSDFDNGFDPKEAAFKQSFADMFGNPDPNQKWSTVSRSTLDVSIDMPSNYNDCTIKVYTANPRGDVKNSYLLGEWKVANGSSSKFAFDMPCDLKTAWVAIVNKDGGRIVKEANIKDNNCKAEFKLNSASTRSAFNNTVTVTTSTDWTGFKLEDYYNNDSEKNSFIEIYPEDDLDYSLGLCTDFELIATGGDIQMTYFYSNTTGTDKLCFFKYNPDVETLAQAYADNTNHVTITTDARQNVEFHWKNGQWASCGAVGGSVDSNLKSGTFGPDEDGYTGRGHTVTISGLDEGEHIVFYLYQNTPQYIVGTDQIASTRSAINQKFELTSVSPSKQVNAQFAGILTVNGVTYLGFEDALVCASGNKPNGSYDLNDIVFTLTGGFTIEDHEDKIEQAMSYVIAYEDLGGSFDFDFNDLVLKATHVAGRNTATLTILAAGGTLPVSISYDEQLICADVHEAFGQSTSTVINALPGKHNEYGTRSFTITGIDDSTNPFALNKISIKVNQNGNETSTIHSPQYYTSSISDEAHQVGTAEDTSIPYAILIADPNWSWCDENVSIATKPGFIDWVQDASRVEWYADGNMWGKTNDVPSNENVISGSTVYQKIEASQFADCTYGATVTLTISDFSADGDLSFYTKYNNIDGWYSNSMPLESTPSYNITSSTSTTVTLDLSMGCEAITDGLYIVYDNTNFKVSEISVTPKEAPNYGTNINFPQNSEYFSTNTVLWSALGTTNYKITIVVESVTEAENYVAYDQSGSNRFFSNITEPGVYSTNWTCDWATSWGVNFYVHGLNISSIWIDAAE